MRKIIASFGVCLLIYIFAFMMLVSPARALTGYDDVITASTVWAVKNTPVRELVGAAASATAGVAGGSLAVEIITVGAPWLALGVAVGLGVAYVYYNFNDLVSIYNKGLDFVGVSGNTKNLIGVNDGIQPALVTNSGATGQCQGVAMGYPSWTYDQYVGPYKSNFNSSSIPAATNTAIGWGTGNFAPPQWELVNTGYWPGSTVYYKMGYCHGSYSGAPSSLASLTPADHSAAGLTDWLANNPADALSPETRHQNLGSGASSPVADTVQTLPLTTTEAGTVTTKASVDVGAGDIVVVPNVPPPAGSQSTTSQTQTSTTTTTTTTNPDGSVTEDSTTQTSSVCTAVGYSNKTFGTVLTSHLMTWQGSPLISSISNLSGVVFPSTLPSYTFNSSMWGNHTLNMNDYSYAFIAVKILVLACTTILCYRLVFG